MKRKIAPEELVMGFHAVRELLRFRPSRVVTLFTDLNRLGKGKEEILALCKKERIAIESVSPSELDRMVQSEGHQMLVAQILPRPFLSLLELLSREEKKERSLILAIDQVFDPQNFGAILRSAEGFGVSAILFSKNRGTDITPVVTKASSGASELLPLTRVSNLAEAIHALQKEGFSCFVSLLEKGATSVYDVTFPEKLVLVVGSEGEGVQPLIAKRADRAIYIPMEGKVESLNVAQATSVLLCARKFKKSGGDL